MSNESGQLTDDYQSYLYWQVQIGLLELYGNQVPSDFNTFCEWLDKIVKENSYASTKISW